MIALYIVAGAFEAVGLVLAAVGFKRTWAEFGTGEKPLRVAVFGPIARRTTASTKWVESRVRRLLRRPIPATVHLTAAATMVAAGRVTARVAFGPLPSVSEDPAAFTAEVHRRIQSVHEKVQAVQDSVGDESRAREQEVKQLRGELDARAQEVEQLSKTVAVGGLVEQVYGWSFIFVGTALGILGNIIQAAD